MTVDTKIPLFAFSAALVFVACPAAQPFDRYQEIIDRKPFGPEPVNFDPEAAPGSAAAAAAAAGSGEMTEEQRTAEEQQLASSVRVSMINVTPAGSVAVGFTDTSANPVENYYLIVGRSQNGWTVKSADPAAESVTLEKDGIDVTVKLGETSGGGAKGVKPRSGGRPMLRTASSAAARGGDAQSQGTAVPGAPVGGLTRLRMRRAEMRAKAQEEAERKAQAEAVAAAEREEREAEEKRIQAEREARAAEERAQHSEAIRQLREQLLKNREAKEVADQNEESISE